jgi:DNA-binding NarL/FixJ family response regulator
LLGGTGVDVMHAVRPKAPGIVFVVLTNHADPKYRRICLEAGASWFFDKSTEFRKIKDVIAGLARVSE